jgi:hypothetical protein
MPHLWGGGRAVALVLVPMPGGCCGLCCLEGSELGSLTVVGRMTGVRRVVVGCSAEWEQQGCETAQRECTRLDTHFDRRRLNCSLREVGVKLFVNRSRSD